MRITCPWCGARPLHEFTYGGDATKARPQEPESASLDAWIDFVYLRDNPAGRHLEYWQHTGGCRSWLEVRRDTRNHEIENVALTAPKAGETKS